MATVTPNFNWPVPTSTDLVKDGATAIEALGDSIDASLLDLKGGTTGQVLSKTSATDMDFTWVTSDDANAIQNTIVDAKGDLITATAADTPARLAVGSNGETLVADSSTSTGLRYTAGNAQGNPVINSAMQVWQRGTSIAVGSANTTYTADRWVGYRQGVAGSTVSRQVTGDTTNLPSIQYCARVQRDSGNTSTNVVNIAQNFETINSIPYAGKTVTISLYARKGANYSQASSLLDFGVASGTGTDQTLQATGYTGAAYPLYSQATLTSTWQRFTTTGTISATATEIAIYIGYTPVGTAGANDYFEVTGVQIDIGSVALPFRTYAGTIQGELAACQRYYTRESVTTTYAYFRSSGNATNTTQARIIVPLPVQMRTKPSALDTGGSLAVSDGVNLYTTGSFVLSANCTTQNGQVEYTHGSGALTQYRYMSLQDNNNGSTYVGFSAEL